MGRTIKEGNICSIKKSFGPLSSGTLVRVKEIHDNGYCTVKLTRMPEGKFLSNLKAYGINESGIFDIQHDMLVRRRNQYGLT